MFGQFSPKGKMHLICTYNWLEIPEVRIKHHGCRVVNTILKKNIKDNYTSCATVMCNNQNAVSQCSIYKKVSF